MAEKINVNEFKNGQTFIHEKQPHIVLESTHSKSGRGQAKVKAKVKGNLGFYYKHKEFLWTI